MLFKKKKEIQVKQSTLFPKSESKQDEVLPIPAFEFSGWC